MRQFRVAGAQINPTVGDFDGNAAAIIDAMAWAEEQSVDALLLPELAVCGYPPEDLVLRESFVRQGLKSLALIASEAGETRRSLAS